MKNNNLSHQEISCLNQLSYGKTYKEIGRDLKISSRTVETYINRSKRKLNMFSKSKLVQYYLSQFDRTL